LTDKHSMPRAALRWFELHSEVDIRHAEEAITVIQDYSEFHQISDALFEQIAGLTLGDELFCRHYFPPSSKLKTRSQAPQPQRVDALTIYRLRIPFHQSFSHALHSREESDAVVVKLAGSDGRSGYGEGLPRAYVTGETTDSMIARIREYLAPKIFQETFSPGWQTIEQLQSLLPDWTRTLDAANGVIAWNAAFCAVELALLDWSLRGDHSALFMVHFVERQNCNTCHWRSPCFSARRAALRERSILTSKIKNWIRRELYRRARGPSSKSLVIACSLRGCADVHCRS